MADDPNPAPTVVTDDDLVALAESLGWLEPTVSGTEGDDGSYTLLIEGTLNGQPIKRGVENATAGYTQGMHGWLADVLRESA